ncbi:MAG TPA: mandelate racemase/muconate lactonizing enzyme family protein [Solirubrobacteraceae bacterium]|jgi:L-alanine-DL-glutamate epimerase-like enolase superfamily enzyme|nr:mandelate racemase/muconate lactonizing enzyme family protein [Solirubrobacteraceae bacterium]
MRLSIEEDTLRLRMPFETAYGTVRERRVLTVTLTDGDGASGHGEAAPLEPYDGVSLARVRAALEAYRPVLMQSANATGAQLIDACRRIDDIPQAFAAIDLALWDRAGRRAGRPVAALLADAPAGEVTVNAVVAATDRAGAAAQAAQAAAQGYECVKLKVGVGDDAGRLSAVRAAVGPHVALRVDANGAWDVAQAVSAIETLHPIGLELVEEPTHGLRAVREVRERVAARVAIDETAAEHGALGAGVADAVCLKVSRCGGIAGLLAAAALVRASGAEVYLASTLDGPLGIAAAVHAAAALASRGPLPPCGLATLGLFEGVDEWLPVRAGTIAVPSSPGLGVDGA